MTEQQLWEKWNRFLTDLEGSARDRSYERHPNQAQLLGYLTSSAPDVDEYLTASPPDQDLDAWLQGATGWSTSTISMHVITCRVCRIRLHRLREGQMSPSESEGATPWWKPVTDVLVRGFTSPRIRWVATAGVISIVFFSLTLSLLPVDPPVTDDTPTLPVERVEPRTGGIG